MFTWYISLSLLHIAAGGIYAVIALSHQENGTTVPPHAPDVNLPVDPPDKNRVPFWVRF
jgi:hypothetical protein